MAASETSGGDGGYGGGGWWRRADGVCVWCHYRDLKSFLLRGNSVGLSGGGGGVPGVPKEVVEIG